MRRRMAAHASDEIPPALHGRSLKGRRPAHAVVDPARARHQALARYALCYGFAAWRPVPAAMLARRHRRAGGLPPPSVAQGAGIWEGAGSYSARKR